MNRQAAFQTAMCTAAVSGISVAISSFVWAANGGAADSLRLLGAFGCLAAGTWAMYLGHCRAIALSAVGK